MQKRKHNLFVDDEAPAPLQGAAKTRHELLDDSSSESEGNTDKQDKPKGWQISDAEGNKYTVSIKETKGKWIYMSTGARINVVEGKSAEETVQQCIDAGDEADLIE